MKKCPTCDKTFEDSMRFCQVDGTPLVDDAPAFDPYATIVAQPGTPVEETPAEDVEFAAAVSEAEPTSAPAEEVVEDAAKFESPSVAAIEVPDNVLDLPESDPLKTMYVSDSEMQAALDEGGQATDIVEIPPIEESPAPEPPSFSVPDVPAPSFGDLTPPPSPFSPSESAEEKPMAAPVDFDEPTRESPMFDEMETVMQPEVSTPFDPPPAAPVAEWTPPPAPDASWQNQEIGSNTPFQSPAVGTGSVNQTLPIISLVLGVISLCCYISPITGIAALITGYLGMKNAKNDPANYGGKGLAIAGMITGGVFFLVGAAYYIIIILMYAGIIAGSMLQGF